jgi:IS4 transposase
MANVFNILLKGVNTLATKKHNSISLQEAVDSCFTPEWILENAKEVEFCKRSRKIDLVSFFWTLLLSFGTGVSRSIADLRRMYEQTSGTRIVPSSFYDRFNSGLAAFLKRAVCYACEVWCEPVEALAGKLADFKDLLVADATVIRLHDFLEKSFPACWTSHTKAALKLHVVMSVLAASPRSVKLTSQRKHEVKVLKVGPWVKDRLMLVDLGYYDFSLFERIKRNGGYFISRLKDNANPLITGVHGKCRGRSIKLVGKRLQEVLPHLKRKSFDVEVDLKVKRREYSGKRNVVTKGFRVAGIWDEKSRAYHIYVTNVPPESLDAQDVARTYRCRWEVELLFKELKNHYRLDQIPSCKRPVVEALVYTAVLTLILSRCILFAMRRAAGVRSSRSPERRWAATFQAAAINLLNLIALDFRNPREWRQLETFLKAEMIDPNVKRLHNLNVARA